MYPVSAAFHTAVANDNPQKALLIFSGCVFTNDDINVQNGIEFRDYFNTEEDLSIGQALSNEISFSLFNDDRLMNDYAFGDFLATLGVLIADGRYSQRGICQVTVGNDTYVANSRSPYLKKNNAAMATQPNQQIKSMLAYDGNLYCFGENENYCIVYSLSNGAVQNVTVNPFMKKKAYRFWRGKGMHYADRILKVWQAGALETYEFCPLGHFSAERPKAPDKIQIDMTCNDWMTKFDEDWTAGTVPSVSYPATIADLFTAVCQSVGLNCKTPDPFINGSAVVSTEPVDFQTATKRDVLKWIAEAACANARIDRDGYVILDWIRQTNQAYDASGYAEFEPYWYKTKQVSKLYNRDSSEGEDKTAGSGDEGYLILDNPLLKGVS